MNEVDELKAHVERLRDAVDGLLAAIEYKKQMSDYPIDSIAALAKAVFDGTPAQSLNHIRAQMEEETIERCRSVLREYGTALYIEEYLEGMHRKYKEQSDED